MIVSILPIALIFRHAQRYPGRSKETETDPVASIEAGLGRGRINSWSRSFRRQISCALFEQLHSARLPAAGAILLPSPIRTNASASAGGIQADSMPYAAALRARTQ